MPEIAALAKTLINTRNLVLDKGDAAKKLVEDAADALDIFVTAKTPAKQLTVKDVLSQPRLDGKEFSATAKRFARLMEEGKFGDVFRADICRAPAR